jgi:hypothetical protein
MAEHKFEFTVAGVELSDQLRQRISADIAVAVTAAIIAHQPGQIHGPVWAGGVGPINGGRLLLGALADKARAAIDRVSVG